MLKCNRTDSKTKQLFAYGKKSICHLPLMITASSVSYVFALTNNKLSAPAKCSSSKSLMIIFISKCLIVYSPSNGSLLVTITVQSMRIISLSAGAIVLFSCIFSPKLLFLILSATKVQTKTKRSKNGNQYEVLLAQYS